MENANRQTLLNGAETIVVKVGSRVLSGPDGCLDIAQVRSLSTQLAALADGGHQVVLVSSGAVASGMGRLGLKQRPSDLARLQAVAAVGQAHLIQTYESYFSTLGRHAAQILLIADDLDHRTRYLNVRNTLLALLQLGVIPIINENDTVAVDELATTFGDNDRLAAMVAGLFSRPALIILSDVEGVYNMNPSNPQAKVLHTIDHVDQSIFDLAVNRTTGISKGGMASKLKAAQFVTQSGVPVIIAGGRVENVLTRLVAGEELGTLFLPSQRGMAPKKRWIGFTAQASGTLSVDAGAARAIRSGGPSLLAIGIVRVSGEFVKGEVLSVVDELGVEIARGLTNFSSHELTKIRGQRSLAIAELLGHCPYEEVIHRDNMTIIG
ncbi:MAG: glutamate 5-kinase [Pirellulaceae bacterium]|jgi:glutamate 5-kinase|nr:glutamate 5-kinase [Pirellulaceae bacterium]